MTESESLTAGRYGFGRRRIHRDDFARVLGRVLPPEGATSRVPPARTLPAEEVTAAAKVCLHVAERFPGERLGEVARTVSFRLCHPAIFGPPGQLVLYPALLLCQEQQALCAIEAPTSISVGPVLEERAARRIASALETAVSAGVRYTAEVMFDDEFVRTAQDVSPA